MRATLFPLAAAGLALLTPALSPAQVRLGPQGPYTPQSKPKPPKAKSSKSTMPPRDPNNPEAFRLRVDAAGEPSPSLKYTLVPRHTDVKPGNAVPYYYRALLAMKSPPNAMKPLFEKDHYDRWMSGPMESFPKEEVAEFLKRFDRTFENLDVAVHREQCDWSWRIQDLTGMEAIAFLIEEVQEARNLARLLILKTRVEIAERRYDDAIATLRTGYKLAEDVARPPTLINDLVGVAVASMVTAELRNLIAAPDSPNMYWAISSLPKPLFDIRPAMRYEMAIPMKVFPEMKNAETARRTPEEWSALIARTLRDVQSLDGNPNFDGDRVRLTATVLVMKGYPRAKRELIDSGMDAERVEAMPVGQVVAIHQKRVYDHIYQEMMKWTLLPYREAYAGMRRSEARLKREGYFGPPMRTREIIPLARLLLPATMQAFSATVTADVRLAGLRVLEAVRMHAAENNGQLPATLAEITVVPVPDNPATGSPFPYRLDGAHATLEIPAPPGRPKSTGWALKITLK